MKADNALQVQEAASTAPQDSLQRALASALLLQRALAVPAAAEAAAELLAHAYVEHASMVAYLLLPTALGSASAAEVRLTGTCVLALCQLRSLSRLYTGCMLLAVCGSAAQMTVTLCAGIRHKLAHPDDT